jgi:hypothetical protein
VIPDKAKYRELATLLGAVRDGNATAEQRLRINDLLERHPELQQYYVEFMLISVELYGYRRLSPQEHSSLLTEQIIGSADQSADAPSPADKARVEEIRAKAQRQLEAFLAEQEALRRQQAACRRDENGQAWWEWFSLTVGRFEQVAIGTLRMTKRLAAVTAVVLLCLALTRAMLNRRVVAVLVEQTDARWLHPPEDPNLHPGLMVLEEGYAEIAFKQGTQIILQAPCTFDLRSKNRMVLERGMVTANVPPQAHGFAVQTPRAQVTDFGTEFGLQVKGQYGSEVHVFQGRVQCRTKGSRERPSRILDVTQDTAGLLGASGDLTLKPLASRRKLFVRRLPQQGELFGLPNKRLDLADIVGGGSGLGTGQRDTCINPATGEVHARYRHEGRQGAKGYVSVPGLSMVDGVFVPLGPGGSMTISSAGHRYVFPPARGGEWWVEIAHGGVANLDDPDPVPLALGDRVFGQGNHPALLMHANVGITFDLDAIRESLGGTHITGFSAYCGVSRRERETGDPASEFYVLVDGELKFHREITMRTRPIPEVRILLNPDNRFLTLACLAGEENIGDWSFFGDAALELERAGESVGDH